MNFVSKRKNVPPQVTFLLSILFIKNLLDICIISSFEANKENADETGLQTMKEAKNNDSGKCTHTVFHPYPSSQTLSYTYNIRYFLILVVVVWGYNSA